AEEFAKAGIALLGVSKDSPKKHAKFIEKHMLTAPLASDAEENGLADAVGIWTEKSMYGRTYMGMERTTFLVDAEGRIARVWRKVKVKGHAEEVLFAARAL
ncbi:MAG TPA: peroxiredoxin, partial [Sphingomonadaceae bacterium]|nr:peroxiredoxin [Sphingomonadaceae bacterium]